MIYATMGDPKTPAYSDTSCCCPFVQTEMDKYCMTPLTQGIDHLPKTWTEECVGSHDN